MSRVRRANRMLAATVLIALVAGCSPTTPSRPEPAPTDVAVAPSPSARPSAAMWRRPAVVPPARWTDCAEGFLCADVRVPREYAAPSRGYMDISVLEMPATDRSQRIGSLVIDPGGPGASGVDFVRSASEAGVFPDELRKRFDIVGFDPRGVNSSTAIRCIDNLDPQAELDPTPDDAAELKALVDSARDYAGECAKRNDTTLAVPVDRRRRAGPRRHPGGDRRRALTYLGFSYGTLIGSLYADLFPDHIRAMVLDGAIDPAIDLRGPAVRAGEGFRGGLTDFLDDCSARPTCEFYEGGKSAAAFDALMASIDKKPLPARSSGATDRSARDWPGSGCSAALYSTDSWRTLATALSLAKSGDGSLLLLLADPYRGRNPNGSYSNLQDAYTANTCLDYPAPTDVTVYTTGQGAGGSRAAFRQVPRLQRPAVRVLAGARRRTPKPVSAAGAPPIVVVGSTRDPATPYAVGEGAGERARFGGPRHPRRRRTHRLPALCARKAVDGYLMDLGSRKPG